MVKRHKQKFLGMDPNDVKLEPIEIEVESESNAEEELRKLVPKVVGNLAGVRAAAIENEDEDEGLGKTYDDFDDDEDSDEDSE